MQQTIDYYNENAKIFVDETADVDFAKIQNQFLELLPEKAFILDFGCGSGRDTKYFLERGFQVEAVDGSEEICKLASEYTGIPIKKMMFHELDEREKYDGIWACASVLHLEKKELQKVLQKMSRAVKYNGIIYISFKYGDFEGVRNRRYFTDLTETSANKLVGTVTELRIEKQWITGDVRSDRGNERWLNMILRKSNIN